MAVLLETSLGDLTIDLYTDERPICKLFKLTLLSLIQLKKMNPNSWGHKSNRPDSKSHTQCDLTIASARFDRPDYIQGDKMVTC